MMWLAEASIILMPFAFLILGGAVELPSYFIAWRCMDKYGRRWVLCIFMCIGGLACLSCVFVPEGRLLTDFTKCV